jgi:uncharacterized membrane protein YkvA (DUF1232 family)
VWAVLIGIVVALLGAWAALVIALAVAKPDGATISDAVRVLPDTIRLVRRLAIDPDLPRSVRRTLWLLGLYLVSPIDLIPDFIPIIGYADDAIVLAIALRRVVRVAGPEAIDRHWTGSPAGLMIVRRLAGLS